MENGHHSSHPLDNEIESVIHEIASLNHRLADLRSRRNADAPISKLPSEILVRIFRSLSAEPVYHQIFVGIHVKHTPTRRSWLNLMDVTHVCRWWRQTALDSPLLWANVCLALGPAWMKEALVRSRDAPLTISYAAARSDYADCNCDLSAIPLDRLTPRIRSFSASCPLNGRTTREFTNALGKIRGQALLLESLSLKLEFSEENFPFCPLPPYWVPASFPRLRHVELQNISFQLHKFPFHNLSSLKLSLSPDGSYPTEIWRVRPTHRPDLSSLLSVLQKMPELEILHLDYFLPLARPSTVSTIPSQIRHVSLKHLKELRMVGPACDCAYARQFLDIPANASQSFKTKLHDGRGEDLLALTSSFRPLLESLPAGCRSIAIHDIIHFVDIRIPVEWDAVPYAHMEGQNYSPLRTYGERRFAEKIISCLGATPIDFLLLHCEDAETSDEWLDAFQSMHCVSKVMVSFGGYSSIHSFSEALSGTLQGHALGSAFDTPRRTLFPTLHTLVFLDTDCEDEIFVEHLRRRQASSDPIQEIHLILCNIAATTLQLFRSIVPLVEVKEPDALISNLPKVFPQVYPIGANHGF